MSLKTSSPPHRTGEQQETSVRATPTVRDIRSRWPWPSLVALSMLVFAALLYLTSYKNFFYDEWDFVTNYRPSQSTSILLPHNEHWTTIPILIWKVLLAVFGLRTHIPYQAVSVAAHVACVLLLFALVRRRSGDLPAFGAALVLLVLGTGASNIVLAFQLTITLSIAFGLLAMLVIDALPNTLKIWHVAAVSGLLLCSLMSSGVGLGFVVAIAVQVVLDRGRRRLLLATLPALGVYLVWFAAYGAGGSACDECPTALSAIRSLDPKYLAEVGSSIWLGLTASVVGVLGLSVFGMPFLILEVILVAFVGLLGWHWYRQGRVESWELGLFAGLVAQFTLIGLTRARFGIFAAADSHFVYVGVVYLLPLIANAVKHIPSNRIWASALSGCVALVVVSNAAQLAQHAVAQASLMRDENAELRVVEMFRGAPDMALDQPLDRTIMPQLTAAKYYAAIDELGSPIPSSTPKTLEQLSPQAVDRAMVTLFGGALTMSPDRPRSAGSRCQIIDTFGGANMEALVADGQSITLSPSLGGDASFSLGVLGPPTRHVRQAKLAASASERITMPSTGRRVMWRLGIKTGPVGVLQVCGAEKLQAARPS